jgi:chromosome segregation ATPase
MRYLTLFIVGMGLLVACGCQNKELLQCQDQLTKVQQERADEKEASESLFESILSKSKEDTDKIQNLETKVTDLEAEKVRLEGLLKETRTKMDKVSTSLIQEKVQLKNEIETLTKELAATKKIFENSSKIALELEEENNKLRAKVSELEKGKQAPTTTETPSEDK